MNHQVICCWLGLPNATWPLDHYTLLGLQAGESNADLIEQRVHERMERVRRYQLTHPELATEAMNRLAQALCCLTDACGKQAYDRATFPHLVPIGATVAAPEPALIAAQVAAATEALIPPTGPKPLDWSSAPPPARSAAEQDTVIDTLNAATDVNPALLFPAPAVIAAPPAAPGSTQVDPIEEAARLSDAARRGLTTKRALYYRIARTRQLLWAWQQLSRFLSDPAYKLARPTEINALTSLMRRIRELLRTFPPLLGEAGQPGYLVLVLARQQLIAPTFQALTAEQRQRLADDWQSGLKLLTLHREFLREEARAHRRRNVLKRSMSALGTWLVDSIGWWLLLIGWCAAYLTVPRLKAFWLEQVTVLGVLLLVRGLIWWYEDRKARPPVPLASDAFIEKPRRRVRPQRQPNQA